MPFSYVSRIKSKLSQLFSMGPKIRVWLYSTFYLRSSVPSFILFNTTMYSFSIVLYNAIIIMLTAWNNLSRPCWGVWITQKNRKSIDCVCVYSSKHKIHLFFPLLRQRRTWRQPSGFVHLEFYYIVLMISHLPFNPYVFPPHFWG